MEQVTALGLQSRGAPELRVCPATLQFANEIPAGEDQGSPGVKKKKGHL